MESDRACWILCWIQDDSNELVVFKFGEEIEAFGTTFGGDRQGSLTNKWFKDQMGF